jgi:hypothetical protein
MSRSLSSLVLACAAACSDAHSPSESQRGVAADAALDAASTTPASDAGSPPRMAGPTYCEHDGRRFKFGESFFDRERCESRLCQHGGHWALQSALCDEGEECDGGPCDECTFGWAPTYRYPFPLGTTLTCSDGCNLCTCTAYGKWISTQVACSELTEVEPCSDMPEVDSSRVLFVSGSDGQALSLQGEFSRGGCDNAPMRACYAALPSAGAQILRVWLEPAKPLAACAVPFIAEAIFSLAPLRERYGDDHEAVVIKVGAYAFPFAL